MAQSDVMETSRSTRLWARVSPKQKTLFQRAAELSGLTLSEFVLASAQEKASQVVQDHDTIRLTQAEQTAFVHALLNPPAPGQRLRQAAEDYKQQLGL
jgi:uncharacterized protein (DUF1778 family)